MALPITVVSSTVLAPSSLGIRRSMLLGSVSTSRSGSVMMMSVHASPGTGSKAS